MGCGTSFVKYVLFFFNLVFALAGLAMVGIGVMVKLKMASEVKDILENTVNVAPLLFIILGSIIFVIAFFGCCGAVRESHCMIVTYAVMLLVIIILQVILAVLVFIYNPQIDVLLDNAFQKSLDGSNEGTAAREAFTAMEQQLSCCGTNGPYSYGIAGISHLPVSCCKETILGQCTPVTAHSNGCITVLSNYFKTLGGISIGVAVVEVIGAIFALCLANSIRNMDRRSRY